MSTSETHSEQAASDDEDFKTNIPYFDDAAPTAPSTQSNSYESLARTNLESIEGDEDDVANFNYSAWENDTDNGGYMDDNLAAGLGPQADYVPGSSAPYPPPDGDGNYYSPSNSIAAAGAASGSADDAPCSADADVTLTQMCNTTDDAIQDIKYSPSEMLLRPPSSAMMQYNYNYPPSPATNVSVHPRPPQQRLPPQGYPTHPHNSSHAPPGMAGPSHSHSHPQPHPSPHPPAHPPPHPHPQAQYGAYGQHHPPGFHPNMWYPNAPYGSNSGYYRPFAAHRYGHYGGGYSHDPMMDMLQLSNSGREARNRAEKNRRDKLNGSIQELSTMVPHVAESPRRVDKTAVLRFAAHGLRLQYVFGESLNQPRPQITDSLMKLLDSFFITLTCHGQIVLISSSIEQHLGHCQADLYGQNILNITHPEDHHIVKQQLIPTDLESLFDIQPDDESGEPRPRTQAEEEYIDKRLREDKRSFTVRLARAGPRSEPTSYEVVKIDGNFRRSDAAPRGVKTSNFPSSLQLIRRSRGRDDAIPLHTISGNDIVLVAIARIIKPPRIIDRALEANTMEYRTRHLIDGRIIDCDQRIGLVAGYMTDEVRNLSPFTFMHQDDARWVIVALRQMYDCNSSYGESTYRLITRNGNFIYLQTKGYLEINKDTNKVHSFICINTLLDEEEGKRRVQEMKNRFSIIINTKIPQSLIDAPAADNPQQLEKAVLCLIQNLQKSPSGIDDDDGDSSSESQCSDYIGMKPSANPSMSQSSMSSTRAAVSYTARSTKTPPLALVPPEPSSVKTSISKSVSVVNVTAAKLLRGHQRERDRTPSASMEGEEPNMSYEGVEATSPTCDCVCRSSSEECCGELCQNANQLAATSSAIKGAVKRRSGLEGADVICEEELAPKRRLKSTEIEHVLSSSLDQLGRTLDRQLNAAIELRDQSNKYEVPNSNRRIDEIMEEHEIQSKIYVNIKSEYEVQLQNNKSIDVNTTKSSTVATMAATAIDTRHRTHQHDELNDDEQTR